MRSCYFQSTFAPKEAPALSWLHASLERLFQPTELFRRNLLALIESSLLRRKLYRSFSSRSLYSSLVNTSFKIGNSLLDARSAGTHGRQLPCASSIRSHPGQLHYEPPELPRRTLSRESLSQPAIFRLHLTEAFVGWLRSNETATRRSHARFSGLWSLRTRLASSPKATFKTPRKPFSISQCWRTARANALTSGRRLLMKNRVSPTTAPLPTCARRTPCRPSVGHATARACAQGLGDLGHVVVPALVPTVAVADPLGRPRR